MSETMVERVARRLCAEAGELPDTPTPYNPHAAFLWQHYRKSARAAIEAMRDEDEITDGMLEAGRVALHAPENRHGAVLGAVSAP